VIICALGRATRAAFVFDAVMEERSVTRAGSRIGLNQPTMSHALSRLRHMLKDELFICTPQSMVPTPRAEILAQPLRNALSEMQLALEPAAFDPAASDWRFALAVNNYAAIVLAPPLVAAASAAAPGLPRSALWARIEHYRPIVLTGIPSSVAEAADNARAWARMHLLFGPKHQWPGGRGPTVTRR
jgi:DNA-binding transcriptional LysR family regulator